MTVSLQNGRDALLAQIDAPVASFFESCVHCGLCAEACLFQTETGEPKYTPIHKVEPLRRVWKRHYTFWGRLLGALGLEPDLSDEVLAEWEPLLYDSCTLCGRCSLACPVGNDIVYMIRKTREGMVASGHAPPDLKAVTVRAAETGSPMGVSLKTLQAQMAHVKAETGLEVPLDVAGADYMVVLSSYEIVQFPEMLGALARIFDRAGVSWTMCSTAFEGTNSGIQIGSSDIAAKLVNRIVEGAEGLGVKTVISPECGHAYTALRWEGPNLIGRPYRFEVKHILEVLDELRAAGRLEVKGREAARLTFHDPCQLVRRGGVVEPPRRLLGLFAEDFVEMEDAGIGNWCCGGGGGVSANSRADELRSAAFGVKKRQLEPLRVEKLVTACANCRNVLEEGLEQAHMDDIEVVGLTELLAEHLADESEGG